MRSRGWEIGIFLAAGLVWLAALGVCAPGAEAQGGPFPFPGNEPRNSPYRVPTDDQREAWAALAAAVGEGASIRWDRETGTPAALTGRLSRPFLGAAREAARAFLRDQANLFIPDGRPDDAFQDPVSSPLRPSRVTRRGPLDHVRVLQYHGDLPVHRGGYTVSLRRRPGPAGPVRQVISAMGRYYPGIPRSFNEAPTVALDEAARVALDRVAPGSTLSEPPAGKLVVYPLGGAFHLAWQIDFRTQGPFGRWLVFVDAHDAAVLEAQDRVIHGQVSGAVWPENPVRSSGLATLPFRDAYVTCGGETVVTDAQGDYDHAGETTVSTALSGPYVDVINEDVAEATYSGPPDVIWSYGLGNTHFDEINVFYHVNLFHDHVRTTLGYDGADVQLPAMVHFGDFFGNAFYDGAMIAFGDGDGVFVSNMAQDDVIYHEYGHFLFDQAISMGYGFNEVGAMQEGGADYFSCSFGNDSVNGESIDLVGWLARDLDNKTFTPPRIYPDFLIANGFEPHYGGEVWGGAFWYSRMALGAGVADGVAFEGLFFLPPDPLFIDGREGIVQADIQLFHGEHKYTIEQLMFERGIGPAPSTDPFVLIAAVPPAGVAPLPVLFRGFAADDGFIRSYYWDLGDGTVIPSGTPDVTHVYTEPGSYTVTLIATDNTGRTGSHSVQVDVSLPGELAISPQEMDIGHVRSDTPRGNFFGDDDVYAGYLTGIDYRGAALFHMPVIPGGTSNVVFDAVTVEFTGQDETAKAPTGGIWSLKLLSEELDGGWRSRGYDDIVGGATLFTLDPALRNGDLIPGGLNAFSVTSTQLPSLHDRAASGSLSFRMDGPFGVNNLFSWDSGYDRFDEDPTATRIRPLLRVSYTRSRAAGDINADGLVDGTDARLAAEAAVGLRSFSPEETGAGDVDRNGVLDERDSAAILAKAAGLIDF